MAAFIQYRVRELVTLTVARDGRYPMFAHSAWRGRTVTRLTAMLIPLLVASACGDGEPVTAPPPTPEPPVEALMPPGGYFVGGPCDFFPEILAGCWSAMVTEDGQVRVDLEDYGRGVGTLQFVGAVDMAAPETWAPGRLIGQQCAGLDPGWACDGLPAEIRLALPTTRSQRLGVRIRYTLDGRSVELHAGMFDRPTRTYATTPATFEAVRGTYREWVADFARHEAVLTTIDASGTLSFRSAENGCTGDGALSPYPDGSRNVYSVEITIKDCNATYAYLNGSLEGLATRSIDRDLEPDWFALWLSSPPGVGSDVALTMGGSRQND